MAQRARFTLNPIGTDSVGSLVDILDLALACALSADSTVTTIVDTENSGSGTPGDVIAVTSSITNTGSATPLDLGLSDGAAVTGIDAETIGMAGVLLLLGSAAAVLIGRRKFTR